MTYFTIQSHRGKRPSGNVSKTFFVASIMSEIQNNPEEFKEFKQLVAEAEANLENPVGDSRTI